MEKQSVGYAVSIVVVLIGVAVSAWWWAGPKATDSILEDKGKEAFDLMAHWSQGNVVALVRHAERCDRSEHVCLDGESGITVPGKEMSVRLGNDFKSLLTLDNAAIYNSPLKRTAQTAHLMFGNSTIAQQWLVDDCRGNLLDDIFAYKEDGRNMVLVTHSTCISNLREPAGDKLIELDADDAKTYDITVFLAVDKPAKQAHVLGYLYPDQWAKVINQRRLPHG